MLEKTDRGQRYVSLNYQIDRTFGDDYRVFGDGVNLTIRKDAGWGWKIDGTIDTERFGRKKLMVVACAFASTLKKSAKKAPEKKEDR